MTINYEKTRDRLMSIVEILLNSMTVFEINTEIHYFYKYWYLFFTFATSISVVSSEISVYLHAESFYEKCLAVQSTGGIFNSNSIFLASQFQSKSLIDVYLMFKNGIRKSSLHRQLKISNEDVFKQCISWSQRFGRLIIAFFINSIMSTLLFAITTEKYDSRDGMTLIYASRYPWDFDTPLAYSFTYILQVICAFPVFLLFWGNMAFITITVIMFQSYIDELAYLIRNPEFSEGSENTNQSEWDGNYEQHMKTCIQLHQQIRKNFIKFKAWFDIIFSAEIAYVTIEVGVLSFIILQEKQTFAISMKLFFYMAVILAQLYFHCNVGEKFYEMNDILTKILYDMIFETTNNRIKNLMMMFIQQTQIPFALAGFSTFKASLQIYMKLIRISYSFFNVLRASVK